MGWVSDSAEEMAVNVSRKDGASESLLNQYLCMEFMLKRRKIGCYLS